MAPEDSSRQPAPIDRAVLERIRSRFAGRRMFESVEIVETGKLHLHIEIAGEYYPVEISARFDIRWYRNDDFNIHYQEEWPDSVWKCRWDRHPNRHNSREHFHPPPDANQVDTEDAQWPPDHRDVCRLVLDYLEGRIETLWEKQ